MQEQPSKICTSCRVEKPIEQFSKNQYGKGNRILRRPVCKECYSKKIKINPKQKREYLKEHPLPAIGEEFFCPICQKTKTRNFKADAVIDHSHIDGSVRGLICGSCNTSIGKFNEDIPTLQRAIEWIKKSLKVLFVMMTA